MATLSIVLVPAKKMLDGRNRIRIAVAHRSQTRYISTQFILDSSKQLKNGRVVKHENAENINAALRKLIYEYEEILSATGYLSSLTCTEVVHLLQQERRRGSRTFGSILKEYLFTMDTEARKKSHKLYNIAGNKLMKYMKGDFPLISLTPSHIEGFHRSMEKQELAPTSIRIYLTLIKVILNYAVKMNYVNYQVHPFILSKMPASHIREIDLTVDELRRIRDVHLTNPLHIYTRDAFMLTYYLGGINLRDLMEYNFLNQTEMKYVRHKTHQSKSGGNLIHFTIQPEAKAIIDKYIRKDGRLAFGPYHGYEKVYSMIYRHLGRVAALAGILRKVSYYSARKSFAQHGYQLGIQIERIEYCIGHSMKSNRPIFNYIRIMHEQANRVFRIILDSIL